MNRTRSGVYQAVVNRQLLSEVSRTHGLFFHVEQRRAWIRTYTHTVVYDHNPDFPRFSRERSGTVKRMARIWLAEPGREQPHLQAYLGTVTFCFTGPSCRDLCRLFHLAARAAKAAGQSARALQRELPPLLRRDIQEEYGVQSPDREQWQILSFGAHILTYGKIAFFPKVLNFEIPILTTVRLMVRRPAFGLPTVYGVVFSCLSSLGKLPDDS